MSLDMWRIGAVAIGVAWGCTTTNERHCGNQDGDATCIERGFQFCDKCSASNDGCTNDEPSAACHDAVADTGGSSTSPTTTVATTESTTMSTTESMTTTMPTTTMSTSMEGGSTTGEPLPCPNGVIDDGEECDGEELGGEDCVSRGFPDGGTLACGDNCRFDESGCVAVTETCGDGVLQEGEECEPGDPPDLNGQTCESLFNQFGGDGLSCNDNCTFNTDDCCIANGFSCSDSVPCCGECVNLVVADQCGGA